MFYFIFALFLGSWAAISAAQELSFVPEIGPHKVGLHVRQQYDQTRVYRRVRDNVTAQMTQTERARPVQSLVWYPAVGRGALVLYRYYVSTMGGEERFDAPAQARRETSAAMRSTSAGHAVP